MLPALVGIIILGAILRFYHLDFNSVWMDEAFTYFFSLNSFSDIFVKITTDCHPPLFYWMEHAVLLFWQSDFALRVVPALLGIATIPVFYLIGKELYDNRSGFVMALFIALSYMHILYSQEARAYTLWLLLFSLSVLALIREKWVWFGILSGATVWAYYLAGVSFAAILTLWKKARQVNVILPFMLVISPLILIIVKIYMVRAAAGGGMMWGMEGITLLTWTWYYLLGHNLVSMLVLLVPFAVGVLYVDRRWLGLIIITTAVFLVMAEFTMIVPRYLFTLLVPIAITIIAPVSKHRWWPYLALSCILIASIFALFPYYENPVKDDWRSLDVDGPVMIIPEEHLLAYQYYHDNEVLPLNESVPANVTLLRAHMGVAIPPGLTKVGEVYGIEMYQNKSPDTAKQYNSVPGC